MQNFTPEEIRPSEFSLNLIRQVAHCFTDAKHHNKLNIH